MLTNKDVLIQTIVFHATYFNHNMPKSYDEVLYDLCEDTDFAFAAFAHMSSPDRPNNIMEVTDLEELFADCHGSNSTAPHPDFDSEVDQTVYDLCTTVTPHTFTGHLDRSVTTVH